MSETTLRRLHAIRRELESRVRESAIIVVLMGASGQGLSQRRRLRSALSRRGVLALVPEDDFPRDIAPSIVERAILSRADIDLAFINLKSWGTATEFGQLHQIRRTARKLRVLVNPEHHPLHGKSRSYLTDLYLTHLAAYGHIYPVTTTRRLPFPSVKKTVMKLAVRYAQWKALR